MPKITADLLDKSPYKHYTSAAVIQRGQQYFRSGHVYEIDYQGNYAICQVEGSFAEYEVEIILHANNHVSYACTCPHAKQVRVCKHMIASILALSSATETP